MYSNTGKRWNHQYKDSHLQTGTKSPACRGQVTPRPETRVIHICKLVFIYKCKHAERRLEPLQPNTEWTSKAGSSLCWILLVSFHSFHIEKTLWFFFTFVSMTHSKKHILESKIVYSFTCTYKTETSFIKQYFPIIHSTHCDILFVLFFS